MPVLLAALLDRTIRGTQQRIPKMHSIWPRTLLAVPPIWSKQLQALSTATHTTSELHAQTRDAFNPCDGHTQACVPTPQNPPAEDHRLWH